MNLTPFNKRTSTLTNNDPNSTIHPIFAPNIISSNTPLLETDYNLHKSNSTYFTDLDISRTALVTNLFSPGIGVLSRAMSPQHKGSMNVILRSVYCSFRREIKPYQRYEVESRVLGWDEKWMYIGSWFLSRSRGKDGKKEVLASALSKYVVKKGRLTVGPARVLEASGYLPERPAGDSGEVEDGEPSNENDGVTATVVPEAASTVLVDIKEGEEPATVQGQWDYEAIQRQRLEGLQVVKAFTALDLDVLQEFERAVLP